MQKLMKHDEAMDFQGIVCSIRREKNSPLFKLRGKRKIDFRHLLSGTYFWSYILIYLDLGLAKYFWIGYVGCFSNILGSLVVVCFITARFGRNLVPGCAAETTPNIGGPHTGSNDG